ncbi:transport protein Sec31 homolog B-like protein isoform X1 [Tanacetum coccineum]
MEHFGAVSDKRSAEERGNALVQNLSRHKGPVRGLEFSSLKPNHLASGAEEGEICIWDIAKPAEPTHFPPLKGSGSATQGEISFLSWNKKVQPILASTSTNGTTGMNGNRVVWDLRKQKPIISFSDSVRRRCSVLQWHPDMATQLIVASDDDSSPSLRVWDMRNTMSPLQELVGHTKGVVAMSWCPNDSSYLLTCAKDNRTICWDTNSAEIVTELPAGTNWNFDVHWYPKIPGVMSASSFDGKIGIYNIEACARYGVGESYIVPAPLKAPKWYQRKAGVTFGFGGKLVSFHPSGSQSGRSEVNVRDLVTELNLVSTSSEFEAAMKSGDRSSLKLLCDQKYQESESEDDRETWGFLKVMFEDEGTARNHLLNHLGFTLPADVNEPIEDLSQDMNSLNLTESEAKEGFLGGSLMSPTDYGEDFFNNLPSPKTDTPVSTSVNTFAIESVSGVEDSVKEGDSPDGITDSSFEDGVQRALVVGDYKGAVAQCVAANKMADALVIAQVGGDSLWENTRDQYLKNNSSPYLKFYNLVSADQQVVSAMVNNDLVSLVNTRPLKSWKETLALLCTFAQGEDWTLLCDTLASRLIAAGNTLAATICYICAGNIDKTVEIWSKNVTSEREGKSYIDLLQDLMEKTVVFALATGQKRFSASLCKLVEKYAEILASQGLLTTAMEYLKLMGNEDLSPELVILRDRIALSSEPEKATTGSMDYGYSQMPVGVAHGANQQNSVVEPSRSGYQDDAAFRRQNYPQTHNYPQTQNYPQTPNYPQTQNFPQTPSPSVNTPYQQQQPTTYIPASPAQIQQQQPTTFIPASPAQVPPVSAAGFTSQPQTQPAPRVFVPSTPPVIRNADLYQQAPSLGSQLYPVNANASFQVGPPVSGSLGPVPSPMVPTPRPKMSQDVGPTPQMRGFMPTSNTGLQRTTSGQAQPPSPTPAAPPAPAPTVQTADVSNVPAHQRPVIITLTRLFTETSEALGGSHAVPAKKREIDDNSKKLGMLFTKLNSSDISKNASEKLVQLCQALDHGDFPTALKIQTALTTSDWDECSFWLATLKRMIKIRQTAR